MFSPSRRYSAEQTSPPQIIVSSAHSWRRVINPIVPQRGHDITATKGFVHDPAWLGFPEQKRFRGPFFRESILPETASRLTSCPPWGSRNGPRLGIRRTVVQQQQAANGASETDISLFDLDSFWRCSIASILFRRQQLHSGFPRYHYKRLRAPLPAVCHASACRCAGIDRSIDFNVAQNCLHILSRLRKRYRLHKFINPVIRSRRFPVNHP